MKDFVDYYEVLGCEPDASPTELKKAYHKKLREYHPDKRHTNIHGLGHQMSQACNEAWEILSDPEKREAYDKVWCRNKKYQERESREQEARERERRERESKAAQEAELAERHRHEGNALYKAAVEARDAGDDASASSRKFQAALNAYSAGIRVAPQDHRLLSNRALCHAALFDWRHCQEDALRVTQINPHFMKGWFMLAKSVWKQGLASRALQELERGLSVLPGCEDLLKLKLEITREMEARSPDGLPHVPPGRGCFSRNPSPCQSRAQSPWSQNPSSAPTPCRRASNASNPRTSASPKPQHPQDDGAHGGRPPPAPHRKASRSPCPSSRAPDAGGYGCREAPDRAATPPQRRPESYRKPRDRPPAPAPAQPAPAPEGMPPADFDSHAEHPSERPRRSRSSLARAAAGAFDFYTHSERGGC